MQAIKAITAALQLNIIVNGYNDTMHIFTYDTLHTITFKTCPALGYHALKFLFMPDHTLHVSIRGEKGFFLTLDNLVVACHYLPLPILSLRVETYFRT